jgi:hypothetical protein
MAVVVSGLLAASSRVGVDVGVAEGVEEDILYSYYLMLLIQ